MKRSRKKYILTSEYDVGDGAASEKESPETTFRLVKTVSPVMDGEGDTSRTREEPKTDTKR